MKVKASSLFFALIISLLIGLVCSGFVLATSWHWISVDEYIEEQRLINNCQSGLSVLLSSNTDLSSPQLIDLYGKGEDSVLLSSKKWGVYDIICSKAFGSGDEISKTAMVGAGISQVDRYALYLADRNSPLSLCGRTLIKGKTYLPEAGVKRAYIEGQNFVGANMIEGTVLRSENRLPSVSSHMVDISKVAQYIGSDISEEVEYYDLMVDSISRSFFEKTLVINFTDSVALSNLNVSGNIILNSPSALMIRRSCKLDKVMIFAPRIYIEEGASFNGQFFASNKLMVGDYATLTFPSVLGLHTFNGNSSEITIGEDVSVVGSILYHRTGNTQGGGIKIGDNTVVTGQVYSSSTVDIKGKIHGSLMCDKLRLKTPSSVYENHLLNVELNTSKLPDDFPGLGIFANSSKKLVISYPE